MKQISIDSLNENLQHAVAEIIIATNTPHSERDCQLVANSLVYGIYRAILETCHAEDITGADAVANTDEIIKTVCCHDYQ